MKTLLWLLLLTLLASAQGKGPWESLEVCTLRDTSYSLEGHWWTPGEPEPRDGSVQVAAGRIESLNVEPRGGVETNGLIIPGLIDLHDHLGYAYAPRFPGWFWVERRTFSNRYEWQELLKMFHENHTDFAKPMGALFYLYGEVRELVGGTTSTANHVKEPAYGMLERNLDGDRSNHGLPLNIQSVVFFFEREGLLESPPRFQISLETLNQIKRADIALVHLAEGRRDDSLTREEFEHFLAWAKKNPTLARKVALIHLVGLEKKDFARLKAVGIDRAVWSPASNMVLYGETMEVSAALREGFTICLGTDWYPTGSDSLFDELRLAKKLVSDGVVSDLSSESLNAMVLESPSKILGGHLGHLNPGSPADLAVVPWEGNLEASLEKADVDTILLVTVDGQPLFGRRSLMEQLLTKVIPSPERRSEYAYGFDLWPIWDTVETIFPGCVPPETLGERYLFYPE